MIIKIKKLIIHNNYAYYIRLAIFSFSLAIYYSYLRHFVSIIDFFTVLPPVIYIFALVYGGTKVLVFLN